MRANLTRVAAWAIDHPWAITPDMLRVIGTVLARDGRADTWIEFVPRASEQRAALREAAPAPRAPGGVAILPIHGVLAPRINLLSDFSGGTTFEEATSELERAAADPAIATIVLDWDSPGGSVAGASEFAATVGRVAASKRVISHANYQCCSAAYWGAARSTEIVASPSALVGSIGVYCLHEDLSKYLETEGVRHTYISAGKYKIDGNPSEPLSETARARFEAMVAAPYASFVADVAAGRGATLEAVRGGFGEGATLTAAEAQRAGLIDRIESFDATVARAVALPPLTASARITRNATELAIEREIAALGFV